MPDAQVNIEAGITLSDDKLVGKENVRMPSSAEIACLRPPMPFKINQADHVAPIVAVASW